MHQIIIENFNNDEEKIIEIDCEDGTVLSIDDSCKTKNLIKGKYNIKFKKHHMFFMDWFINDEIIKKDIIFPIISDQENSFIINSNMEILIEKNKDISIKTKIFPMILTKNENGNVKFELTCLKTSQLSFYFHNENEKNYRSLTLVFDKEFCKVYLDEFIDKKFIIESRKNISLFNTKLKLENVFLINKNEMIVENDLMQKKYDLSDFSIEIDKFLINETYSPNGQGSYIIKDLFLSN